MILSDKYIVVEDTIQITLFEKYMKAVKKDGKETGEFVEERKLLGNYSRSAEGRAQAYNRIINCEISGSDKQDLRYILEIVSRCEEQVKSFWEKQ